jgi:hypothetical protein
MKPYLPKGLSDWHWSVQAASKQPVSSQLWMVCVIQLGSGSFVAQNALVKEFFVASVAQKSSINIESNGTVLK